MTPRLVVVTWHDAHASAADEYEKAKHHQPCVMYTVGWVVDRDETGISVACERYHENGTWHYRAPTFIPGPMIQKVSRP